MYHFMPHCLPSSATNDFFLIGKLIAMSILQGGCGFPVLHPAAYNYLEETMWDK